MAEDFDEEHKQIVKGKMGHVITDYILISVFSIVIISSIFLLGIIKDEITTNDGSVDMIETVIFMINTYSLALPLFGGLILMAWFIGLYKIMGNINKWY